MTAHALARIAERFPGVSPSEMLNQITHQHQQGSLPIETQGCSDSDAYRFDMRDGRVAFPLITDDGAVKTVLNDGMTFTGSAGVVKLGRKPLGAGVHDISAERYHSDPCANPSLSNTIGKLMLDKSPAHAWTASPLLNPDWEPQNTKAFDVGRAAHAVILGKGEGYAVCPEQYLATNGAMSTKAAKEWITEQREAGLTPLLKKQAEDIEAMAKVMRQALIDLRITLDPEHSEKVAIAELGGVMNRCMVDNVPVAEIPGIGLVMLDLKTTETATDAACRRSMASYGYDFQDEHYKQVWKGATGEDRTMLFLFQEKSAPFEVNALIQMKEPGHSADWGETAKSKVYEARRTWRTCLETDNWPGYPRLISSIGAPPYHAAAHEERQDIKASAEALIASRAMQEPKGMTQ